MTASFTFRAPTDVVFGRGARAQIAEKVDAGPCGVLSSPSVLAKPEVQEVLGQCGTRGSPVVELGSVSPNPRLGEIQAAFEVATSAAVGSVLAIGGGSAIDAGKLLGVALRYAVSPAAVLDRFDEVVRRSPSRTCRVVAVPTTAGTGAEVSKGAIITDEQSQAKRAARGPELIPDAAVIDPELALTLPTFRTAETGFDIVTHAIETYMSKAATPVTDILALAALDAVPQALRRAVRDGSDMGARETLALHSWLMGYNLAHASTCLPHRMQYPVGARTDTSHQIGLAALYPAWFERVAQAAPAQAEEVLRRLGDDSPSSGPGVTMRRFLADVGLDTNLQSLGIDAAELDELASAVTGRVDLDPIDPSRDDVRALYHEAYG